MKQRSSTAVSSRRTTPLRSPRFAFPLLVEAAVRCGDLTAAHAAHDRFSERAAAAGTEWALGLLASTRALLATDDAAEAHYSEALDRLARTSVAVDLARVQLLYGEWLRRTRRRRDARNRYGRRSSSSSGSAPERSPNARDVSLPRPASTAGRDLMRRGDMLTAQEAQIARLVADGMTNPQIACQLYISKSTVEYHLRKIYRKLGVTTRTQLARLVLSG